MFTQGFVRHGGLYPGLLSLHPYGMLSKLRLSDFHDYRIASNPLRRMTLSRASAGPLGCLVPRSNCEM